MAEFRLVCEGHEGSLDGRVLNVVLAQKLGVKIRIDPSHGDKGIGAVRQYLQTSVPETIAFSIEDRNYRPATPWRSGAMRLVWSRHEIENYLLEPPIVFAALSTIARTPEGRKAGPLPGSLEDASAFLTECARPLLELHAARMLFDEVLRELGEAATKPADPFQDSRGGRPRGEYLRLLATELKRLTAAASTLKELAHRWEGDLEERLDALRRRVLAAEFLSSGQYLVDMDGHALVSAVVQALHRLGLKKISVAGLERYLVEALDAVYVEGQTYGVDDFAGLRDRLVAAGASASGRVP